MPVVTMEDIIYANKKKTVEILIFPCYNICVS